MAQGRLEALGYMERDASARLDLFIAQPRSYLVDIRFKPWSGWKQWNRDVLQVRYRGRYVHMAGLANSNQHQRSLPIHLVHPTPHVEHLAAMLKGGSSYLLLCSCKDAQRCHRTMVLQLVWAELGQALPPEPEPEPERVHPSFVGSLWETPSEGCREDTL